MLQLGRNKRINHENWSLPRFGGINEQETGVVLLIWYSVSFVILLLRLSLEVKFELR